MISFREKYERDQHKMRLHKLALVMRRALNVQARAKIKPSSMNPVLLNKPGLRGGDAISLEPDLNLYYPTEDSMGGLEDKGDMGCD